MRQDSRLNKGGKIGFAIAFCSVAIFAISIAGCGSDGGKIDALCSRLDTCSKLDQLGYTSYDHCVSSNKFIWDGVPQCNDAMADYMSCVAGLECEQLTQVQLVELCKDEVHAYMNCSQPVADEQDEEEEHLD